MPGEPFTVFCAGNYNFTFDDGTATGVQSFNLTVSPEGGLAMMTNLEIDGTYDRSIAEMDDEIREISEISEQEVRIGRLNLDRMTGKYSYTSTTRGDCRTSDFIPIPSQAQF